MTDLPSLPPPPPPQPPSPPAFGAPPPGYQAYQAAPAGAFAGFGSRLGAYIIDGLIAGIFGIPAIIVLFAGPSEIKLCTINEEANLCDVPKPATIAIAVLLGIIGAVAFLMLYAKKVGSTGQSWGMKATGVKVVDATTAQPIGTGRAVGRYFARILSGAVCYLGFLWMLWDPRKQTWHDKLVNTVVLRA